MANEGQVFGSSPAITDAWSITSAIVNVSSDADQTLNDKLLALNIGVRFARSISTYFPINKTGRVYIAGYGDGAVTLGVLVGPSSGVKGFIDTFGNICNAKKGNNIVIQPQGLTSCSLADGTTGTQTGLKFTCSGCALQGVDISISTVGEIAVVTTTMTIKISGLKVEENAASASV